MKRLLILLFTALFLISLLCAPGLADDEATVYSSYAEYAFSGFYTRPLMEGEQLRYGIDVSQHQGVIDWQAVADSGITFAYVRLGFRSYTDGTLAEDSMWRQNVEGALSAGLQTGVYIYSQAITVEEAAEEAQFVIDRIGNYGITLPIVQDFEFAGSYYGLSGRLYYAGLSRYTRTAICYAFAQTVLDAGYTPMTYATLSMLEDELYSDYLENVWISHYNSWTSYRNDYDFWQCTDEGWVPGVEGTVDLDVWYDDGTTPLFQPLPFSDISVGNSAYESIRYCYEHGIVSGTYDGTYEPNAAVTRAQLLTMLYRVEGSPEVDSTAAEKVCPDYAAPALTWASENRILIAPISFCQPEGKVTRQEFSAMLYRLAGSPKVSGNLNDFTDGDSVRSYYRNAMLWATQNGIIQGTNSGKLKPTAYVTREIAAIMIARYLKIK